MRYLTAAYTDAGTRKKTNQDSLLLRVADTGCGRVALAVLCDGMGGLAKGEVASAGTVRVFARWFEEQLPSLLERGWEEQRLHEQWEGLIREADRKIAAYGRKHGISLGTTLAALLLVGRRFYIVNIGDCRVYQITDQICQLTRDQTYVQQKVDRGDLTPEEAEKDPQRNILLQCVGAGSVLLPDYYVGDFGRETVFMLCCDGFRHAVRPEEFYQTLNPRALQSESAMEEKAALLTRLNRKRRESDNITVGLIKAY